MTAIVTTAARDCVYCVEYRDCLRMQARILKVFTAFEELKSVVIDISGLQRKNLLGFHYIIVIADQFPKLA